MSAPRPPRRRRLLAFHLPPLRRFRLNWFAANLHRQRCDGTRNSRKKWKWNRVLRGVHTQHGKDSVSAQIEASGDDET
eukprot:641136-Pyramimonas_sp.AAC.1